MENKNSKKVLWITLAVLVVAVVAVAAMMMLQANKASVESPAASDNSITSNEIGSIDLGNLDSEIKNLDSNINKL